MTHNHNQQRDNMAIEQEITKFLLDSGALKVGFTNQEKLKNGPPSTVLSTYLPEAKSAIVFALPLDREIARSYLAKDNINARSDHEKKACEIMKKAFTEDRPYHFDFFPSPSSLLKP